MTILYILLFAIGVLPFLLGFGLLRPVAPDSRSGWRPLASSTLLCALAFNLTFFWQEIWLVVPKALAPGLDPVLYHNDHNWTGANPLAELLQGTGAIGTLAIGLVFLALLAGVRRVSVTWRLFFFWMAFQGLFQSLSQLAIGTLLPGNDMGRALVWLGLGQSAKTALLVLAVALMAAAGAALARFWPAVSQRTRRFAWHMLGATMLSILLVIPFRVPREPIEVVLIPLAVNLIGLGWLVLGAALTRPSRGSRATLAAATLAGPTIALALTLLFFQLVLRPGIAF